MTIRPLSNSELNRRDVGRAAGDKASLEKTFGIYLDDKDINKCAFQKKVGPNEQWYQVDTGGMTFKDDTELAEFLFSIQQLFIKTHKGDAKDFKEANLQWEAKKGGFTKIEFNTNAGGTPQVEDLTKVKDPELLPLLKKMHEVTLRFFKLAPIASKPPASSRETLTFDEKSILSNRYPVTIKGDFGNSACCAEAVVQILKFQQIRNDKNILDVDAVICAIEKAADLDAVYAIVERKQDLLKTPIESKNRLAREDVQLMALTYKALSSKDFRDALEATGNKKLVPKSEDRTLGAALMKIRKELRNSSSKLAQEIAKTEKEEPPKPSEAEEKKEEKPL